MLKSKLSKRLTSSVLAGVLGMTMVTTSLPTKAEAFDVLSGAIAIAEVAAQYTYLNKQVNYLDNKGRNEFLGQVKEEVGVNGNYEANAMLGRVMHRLSNAVAATDPTIAEKPYNYFVNNQQTFNAFCTLGHNMSVNIGLFDILNYNEDEIAFVVGHEMGHGQRNDPANGVKKQMPLDILTALYQSQNPNAASVIGAKLIDNIGTAKTVTLPMEKRADKSAFEYCSAAGYNVGAGAAVWQRVIEKMGVSKAGFVSEIFNPSDHPGNLSRRDTYSKDITKWSNDKVKVDKETGALSVNGKVVGTPAATDAMSSLERAYLIAGNMASVYHDKAVKKPVASTNGSTLYLNGAAVMTINGGDNAASWVEALNTANKIK